MKLKSIGINYKAKVCVLVNNIMFYSSVHQDHLSTEVKSHELLFVDNYTLKGRIRGFSLKSALGHRYKSLMTSDIHE